MPLYHIQDSEFPMWVIADGYVDALTKWRVAMSRETPQRDVEGPTDPQGINHICDDDEIIR